MTTPRRSVAGALLGLALLAATAGPASAQELPTGAARLVEKVKLQAAVGKLTLLNDLAEIQAKAESVAAGLAGE